MGVHPSTAPPLPNSLGQQGGAGVGQGRGSAGGRGVGSSVLSQGQGQGQPHSQGLVQGQEQGQNQGQGQGQGQAQFQGLVQGQGQNQGQGQSRTQGQGQGQQGQGEDWPMEDVQIEASGPRTPPDPARLPNSQTRPFAPQPPAPSTARAATAPQLPQPPQLPEGGPALHGNGGGGAGAAGMGAWPGHGISEGGVLQRPSGNASVVAQTELAARSNPGPAGTGGRPEGVPGTSDPHPQPTTTGGFTVGGQGDSVGLNNSAPHPQAPQQRPLPHAYSAPQLPTANGRGAHAHPPSASAAIALQAGFGLLPGSSTGGAAAGLLIPSVAALSLKSPSLWHKVWVVAGNRGLAALLQACQPAAPPGVQPPVVGMQLPWLLAQPPAVWESGGWPGSGETWERGRGSAAPSLPPPPSLQPLLTLVGAQLQVRKGEGPGCLR